MKMDWEQQQGGLYLTVRSFDKTEADERDAVANILRGSIQKIAQNHGAAFSETGFHNNMRALFSGDIQADLFMAKWEVCTPKPKIMGAGLNWDTFGITHTGETNRAVYTEDVCLLTNKVRELIREKPTGKYFPEESLIECFERISLRRMLANHAAFRFGEVNGDNTRMMRNLWGNGAIIGIGSNSAVLEFKELPSDLISKFPMSIETVDFTKNGSRDEHNFYTQWKDGPHEMRFIATKGQATAVGRSRADIRPWRNGHTPEKRITECVIASSLLAIKREAEERGWGSSHGEVRQAMPSPDIPLLGSKTEIMSALYGASSEELSISTSRANQSFDKPMPDAHIFVLNDQHILDAFVSMGAKPRVFGDKPMIPGVNVLRQNLNLAA